MPQIERRAPRPATVEEFDEYRQVALPESLRTANVSGRRPQQEVSAKQGEQSLRNGGSDSGYASRADTVSTGSTSAGRRKMPDLRVDTAAAIPERTRQPYSSSKAEPTRQPSRRQSSSQGQPPANPPKSKPISQEPEICHRYDHYAKHGDMRTDVSATSSAPPPPSPRTVRQTGPKTSRDDTVLPTKIRRSSSQQQSRPVSMVAHGVPLQYINQAFYETPAITAAAWPTPVTPSVPYSPASYSYGPPPVSTPSFAYYQQPSYFEHAVPMPEPHSARPSRRSSPVRRRSSTYGEPVLRQSQYEPPPVISEKVPSRENRPPLPSHKPNRSIDHDRVLMPPPAKPPQYQPETTHRPSTRRAKTYHVQQSPVHQHFTHNLERFDEDFEDYDCRESRMPLPPTRERRESSSRPPTSYRGARVATEARDRPALPAKSMSYSTSAGLAKTPSRPNIATRQTTQSAVAADDGEMAVEEYLERRNKTSNELTAEALRNLNHRNTSSRSETESSYSHKSRQSSSKDSSGLGKSQATTASTMKTSIALSGGGVNMSISPDYMSNDGRPVSISIGNVVVKVATQESEAADRTKEVKRIERAPSVASRASKNSVSSVVSSFDRDRDRDRDRASFPTQPSRRPSRAEERGPSVRSSRQHSRAPSTGEHGYEGNPRRSLDYARKYEEVYGA
ncbi:hypothetical protein ABEF92_001494 [Exophiala dermatitidis]|uniref:Uncharacterized protein n=1 Tax=Exophiala dermatitidis (strain ATCC 34100 / CBS 525.76 / NIH/UT8656) TaxID=858893 RepID=H6C968_EXODN|nr:uncharacterized protein HMPREF1120_08597 [Exophiala dermatitidis NIH/UT8656]EHY60645.1 hypothetical protein HMPREF1120_08597 [Exophiala dermatitidis NIH/UT8656]